MRLIECGVSSHLTIETLTRIIRTKNKNDALLEKSVVPHKSKKIFVQTTSKTRCGKDPIKQRIKNKVLFSKCYRFEFSK